MFYGGAAGGGKTDLLLGAAYTQHHKSIIFRREFAQLKGIRERAEELFEKEGKFNGQQELWRFPDGKRIEFGACQYPGDEKKYQGRPHDLKAFDEITHFTEAQFRFLITWRRTDKIGQRTRVICAGNPPTDAQGDWVIRFWAPWLDPKHPNPAKDGELRWFITDKDGNDLEVDGPDPVEVKYDDGTVEVVKPVSRTFIRAKVEDNPYLMQTGYKATLQALPEPLRSMMLRGDFQVGLGDAEWQVIPTQWVLAAQARWRPSYDEYLKARAEARRNNSAETASVTPQSDHPPLSEGSGTTDNDVITMLGRDVVARTDVDTVGVDVARGGKARTCIAPRKGNWFDRVVAIPGRETKDGNEVINTLIRLGFVKAQLQIDVTGVGTSPVDIGKMYGLNVVPMNSAARTEAKDRSGKLGFVNTRAEWWWKFREALDPVLGDDIALPPDPEILADLTAPRWSLTIRGIKIEDKEDIFDRIGRSTDKGDAIVFAHALPHISGLGFLEYYSEMAQAAVEAKKQTEKANEAVSSNS